VDLRADPIADRKALMKKNGDEAKIGTQFMKGEAPFDLAKAKAIFATYEIVGALGKDDQFAGKGVRTLIATFAAVVGAGMLLLDWPLGTADGLAALDNCAWAVLEESHRGRLRLSGYNLSAPR